MLQLTSNSVFYVSCSAIWCNCVRVSFIMNTYWLCTVIGKLGRLDYLNVACYTIKPSANAIFFESGNTFFPVLIL